MSTNKRTIRIYWEHVKKHRASFMIMLVAIPAAALLIDTILPYFLSQAIGFLAEGDMASVKIALVAATTAGLIGAALNYTGFGTMVWHEAKIRTELSDSTFAHIINKDARFFANTKVGALTTRFIDFVRSEVTLQDLLIIRTLGFILSVGVGIVILANQSLVVAGIVFGFIVALIIQIRWSIRHRTEWRHERKRLVGEVHGMVADAVTNNTVVKAFAGEKREIAEVSKLNQQFARAYHKDIGFIMKEGSARVALMVIIQIVAIYISITMVESGSLTIATAVFMLAYLQRIGSQLFILGDILNGFDQALLDAGPMSDMLGVKNTVVDIPHAKNMTVTEPSVQFKSVDYAYEDSDNPALAGINLSIPAGQKVGLVGHSGAGKTTLSHLLLRLDDPTGGTITIGSQDIHAVNQASLRQTISFVPQESSLFHRSLRENIAYGKPGATDSEIITAAKQANAWGFIQKLPDGLDTLVGERGVKLSGGQRQRIAIARAILKDAPILVLDEATSALDSESEKLIQESLSTLMQGRTSIVIAHRLSTIAKLDRIIVLDQGKIIEDGSHAELLAKNGIYAKLWSHQSGGFMKE